MKSLDERYLLGRQIGWGGIGEVYEGLQSALDRPVAIKLLRPEYTANPWVVARFQREAQTLSRLQHPNVVTVIDVGMSREQQHFLVMELLKGQNLAVFMQREGQLHLERALSIAASIVRGMGAGQGVGLVHRDLKPENIFLTDDGQVKILDFGLAMLRAGRVDPTAPPTQAAPPSVDGPAALTWTDAPAPTDADTEGPTAGRLTSQGTVLGTPRYISPEQALGWQVDHRADLYAFGCILFEMLAGRPPFEAESAKAYLDLHVRTLPPLLDELRDELPQELVRLIDDLLSKDPAARPADWAAVAEQLRRLHQAEIPEVRSNPSPRQGGRGEELRPTEPYRFLQPFSAGTRAIFFGRERDVSRFRQIWEDPDLPPLVMLTGASGVGKTSFLYARVVPWLRDTGHELFQIRGGDRPMDALHDAVCRHLQRSSLEPGSLPELLDVVVRTRGQVAVVLDQLEEVFTEGGPAEQAALQAGLAAIVGGGAEGVRFLLSIREEFLGRLLRTLHPLPVDQLSRTFTLRPLESEDIHAALVGPSRVGLPVDYAPFRFADGLAEEITADLMDDHAGEVAPRIQAVGYRLWEMVRDEPDAQITRRHYRERLGGAREIVSRVLDEAIAGLDSDEQDVAKELLRALTHLPGSPTSHPSPESALVGFFTDADRRRHVLRSLESSWRILHGYVDPRWPDERTYRIAHEALIARIQDYGEESHERNRARQVFHQGLALWLKNGRSEEDLLPDAHFELVRDHAQDLVFTTADQRAYFESCQRHHNEGWLARYKADRRARIWRRLHLPALGLVFGSVGVVVGQFPLQFHTLQTARVHAIERLDIPAPNLSDMTLRHGTLQGVTLTAPRFDRADLRGTDFYGAGLADASFREADLSGARLDAADLIGADLTGARVERARFQNADLRAATLAELDGEGDFLLARFDNSTDWGDQPPPMGALGPRARAGGLDLSKQPLQKLDLFAADLSGATLREADLSDTALVEANLDGVRLGGALLRGTDLGNASLVGAELVLTSFAQAKLINADLRGADLRGASLVGADLQGAQMEGADLAGALADRRTQWPAEFDLTAHDVILLTPGEPLPSELGGADLRGADLSELELGGARLAQADLADADLSGADLSGADLAGANLRGASLKQTDVCGADLTDAQFSGAEWEGATDCEATTWSLGARPVGLGGS